MTGSAGGKAESRRPDMGRALSEYADKVYLTSDDPNFEDPRAIAAEIAAAITAPTVIIEEQMDRSLAVQSAVAEAASQDIVILAGKGAEQYLKVNGQKNLMKVICRSLSVCFDFSLPHLSVNNKHPKNDSIKRVILWVFIFVSMQMPLKSS